MALWATPVPAPGEGCSMQRACAQELARCVSGSGRNLDRGLLVPLDCSGTTAAYECLYLAGFTLAGGGL